MATVVMGSWCQRQYGWLSLATLVAVYMLIAAGGVVRSLGAGMGCPDWPKCYDRWVPPTSVVELPSDYRAQYYAARRTRNLRLAYALERLQLRHAAAQLRAEAAVFQSEPFDVTKAWIEYLNRLLGVLVGGLMLVTGLCSLSYLGTRGVIFWCSLAAGLGTASAALMGAVVVATHLLPFTVTLHMAFAFVVVAALLTANQRSRAATSTVAAPVGLRFWIWGLGILFLVQVLLGTQLREEIDRQLLAGVSKNIVLDTTGALFYMHRTAAWGVLLGQIGFCYWLRRQRAAGKLQRLAQATAVTYATEAALGASLYYLALPAAVQPLHLLLAFVAFGLQALLLIACKKL